MIRSRQDDRWPALNVRMAYAIAHALLLEGRAASAVEHLERMVEAGVDSPTCWLLLARCKAKLSRFDECERALEFSVAYPSGLAHKLHECCVYEALSHYGEALGTIESVTEEFPYLSAAWLLRGDISEACHRRQESLAAYEEAISSDCWMGLDAGAAQLRLACLQEHEDSRLLATV